jgi:hypothetical protein
MSLSERVGGVSVRAALMLAVTLPCRLAAQLPDSTGVLRGRVEDLTTRVPIEGARVFTDDSTSVAITDSLGNFDLAVPAVGRWVVYADRFGYLGSTFELVGEARSSRFVLLMEPAPLTIEPLTVEVEASIDLLVRNLEARRNAYPSAMKAMDRQWIERFGPTGGSALDLVFQADRRLFECSADRSHLCVRGRIVTFRDPYPENRLFVCIDGWLSLAPTNELNSLPTASVALVEVYARSQIRVYSAEYLLSRARRGWTTVSPFVPSIVPDCT